MTESKSIYLQKVKENNLSLVLYKIWEFEAISRIELVKHTGLTSGTITNLTYELISSKLIRESEAISKTVGRRRINLRFDTSHYYMIAIDISRLYISASLHEVTGKIVARQEYGTEGIDDPNQVLMLIEQCVQQWIEQAIADGHTIIGIGVSIPGPMDITAGKLLSPPNFGLWEQFPLRQVLERKFGIRVMIEDDSRASALAEKWFGGCRKCKNLVFVSMGIGIGGGVIQDGQILHGANGLYGQIGQMSVMLDFPYTGSSPNHGCWEDQASIPGILKRWGKKGSLNEFMMEVQNQEPEAVSVWEDTLSMLESALVTMYNVYDPEVIVIGGKLYPHIAPYLDAIVEKVKTRVHKFMIPRVRINAATYGDDQTLMGAAAVVLGCLFDHPQWLFESKLVKTNITT